MIFLSNNAFAQEPIYIQAGKPEYTGWIYHSNGLSIGTNLQPQSELHLHNGSGSQIFTQFTNSHTTNGANNGFKRVMLKIMGSSLSLFSKKYFGNNIITRILARTIIKSF